MTRDDPLYEELTHTVPCRYCGKDTIYRVAVCWPCMAKLCRHCGTLLEEHVLMDEVYDEKSLKCLFDFTTFEEDIR